MNAAAPAVGHRLIGFELELPARHLLPEQHQRLLHQGQHARFAGRVMNEFDDQRLIHRHAHGRGGLHNRGPQFVITQGRQFQAVGLDRLPQRPHCHQLGVKVGAHGEQDVEVGRLHKGVERLQEVRGLTRIGQGEKLLELVDEKESGRMEIGDS